MNKFVAYIVAVALFVACNNSSQFVLDCKIKGATQGEMVCLIYPVKREGVWYTQCDTTYINNGTCRFKGNVDDIVPTSLVFANMDELSTFIAPTDIELSAERSALYDYTISGLEIDDEITEYNKFFATLNERIYKKRFQVQRKSEEYVSAYENNAGNTQALALEFYTIVEEHKAMEAEWETMAINFITSHPDYTIIPNIINNLAHSGYDTSEIESLYSNLSNEQRHSTLGVLMSIRCDITKYDYGVVGSKAPDFTLYSAENNPITLSKCYAEGFVLLDFWASWCKPCIKEIPILQELHSQYKGKLQFISISVDENKTQWQDAIAKYDLSQWPQLITNNTEEYYFREQANISLAYGIESIPCFMLIDKDGTIVGRWSHLTPDVIATLEQIIYNDNTNQ
ncbi:MAG: AhpC/TSA family protein [Alistipes sp.]|nr:AhpC/TSA family protein [Alistipes sp.]